MNIPTKTSPPSKTFKEKIQDQGKDLPRKAQIQTTKTRERFFSKSYYQKIYESLWNANDVTLYNQMKKCDRSLDPNKEQHSTYQGVCQSPWCKGCRNFLYYQYYKKVVDRITYGKHKVTGYIEQTPILTDEVKLDFEYYPYQNSDLRMITGVCGLARMDIKSVQKVITEDTKKWRGIRRYLSKLKHELFWIECVYELELVDWSKLKNAEESDYKKIQMKQLIERYERSGEGEGFRNTPFVFVHWHGITNLKGDELNYVFRKYYWLDKEERLFKTNPHTGLYVQKFHKNKPLELNIQKITSYPFKNAMRYKHSYIGSDYTSGEYFTTYELGGMISLYSQFIGRNGRTLWRSLSNDAEVWFEVNERLVSLLRSNTIRGEKYKKLSYTIQKLLIELRKKGGGSISNKLTPLIFDQQIRDRLRKANWLFFKFQPIELTKQERRHERKMELFSGSVWIDTDPSSRRAIYKRARIPFDIDEDDKPIWVDPNIPEKVKETGRRVQINQKHIAIWDEILEDEWVDDNESLREIMIKERL